MVNGDFTNSLRAIIHEYDRRIAETQKELQKLAELKRAAAMLLENEIKGVQHDETKIADVKPFVRLSTGDAIISLLRANGNHPMHAKEITKALKDGGWHSAASNPQLTVVGTIVRDGRFERTGPNTFRLTEKGGSEAHG